MQLSVAIVDDDPRYRSSMAHEVLAASDLALAGVADDLESGRALFDAEQPNVLLVDLGLPGGCGLDLIRHAVQHRPTCEVMVVTVFGDEQHVIAALEAGATGYLLKDARNGEMADHIRALHAGGSPISPIIARRLLARFSGPNRAERGQADIAAPAPKALSPQEHKVLLLTSQGHSYDEIAQAMGVSRQTVLTYVKRTYRKLQVHTKIAAVRAAERKGWLPG